MTPPPNPAALTTARDQARVVAYMGAAAGERPTEEDELTDWTVVEIQQLCGSQGHAAKLLYDLGSVNPRHRLQNLHLSEQQNRQIEIWLLDPDTGERLRPLFWGEVNTIEPAIDNPDQMVLEARTQPHHFGDLLEGMELWDEASHTTETAHGDVWFNPAIDGEIVGNRAAPNFEHAALPEDYSLWIDAESTRTDAALQAHGDMESADWKLSEAIETLCGLLNADEMHVDNFTRTAVNGAVRDLFADALEVRDVRLPRGQYLPALLDALLPAHGYGWALTVRDVDGHAKPWITVYQRGDHVLQRDLKLQKPGAEHDVAKDPLASNRLTIAISDLANRVIGHGSQEEREITLELVRGWPSDLDDLTADDLNLNQEGGVPHSHRHAWRLWPGNEGADYTDTRAEITAHPDFAGIFTTCIPKRRPLGPCLTQQLDADGQLTRMPAFAEYSIDAGETWLPIDGGKFGYRLLPDQIGILFTGETPPEDLIDAGADARVRITGTILGDARLRHVSERADTSAQSSDLTLLLDLSDRFHDRSRVDAGDYASRFAVDADGAPLDPLPPADERDDAADLETWCDRVRATEDAALVSAQVILDGLHFQHELGTVVKGIDGRRIDFNRLANTAGEQRYPQLTGRRWTFSPEQTILSLEPFDFPIA